MALGKCPECAGRVSTTAIACPHCGNTAFVGPTGKSVAEKCVLLHLIFPASSGEADKKIAWNVVLLVCGIVTYVAALQRYGTVEAVGSGIAR